jgi:hypothetical protein
MKYLLTIYGDESSMDNATPDDMKQVAEAYGAYTQEAEKAGILVAGEGLQGSQTATTVRVREGERSLTDGPFAETKEQLLGFYMLECNDLDDAVEWGAKIPGAQYGSVEVRPVMVYDEG